MGIAARLYRDARWAERHQVELEATLRDPQWAPVDVAVEDLSSSGFRITTPNQLPVGAEIALGIAGIGTHAARVVWGASGIHGCEFLEPLSEAELRTALAAPSAEPVSLPFARNAAPAEAPAESDDAERKLPMPARVAVIALGTVLSWAIVIALGWAIYALVRALMLG